MLLWGTAALTIASMLVAWSLTRWLSLRAVFALKLPVWIVHASGVALFGWGLGMGDVDGWAMTVFALFFTLPAAAVVGLLGVPIGLAVERRTRAG